MNKILLLIICLPLTFICAQQNTIVSLENDNIWIYEANYYQTIDTIQNFASYCTVFKIIGDTSILGKQVKIIGITEYDSCRKYTEKDYWFSDNSIFQMNTGYSSVALVTFYDKNRLIDSSWSHSGMGGYYSYGSIRKINEFAFDSIYIADDYSSGANSPYAHGTEGRISAEKFGMLHKSYNVTENYLTYNSISYNNELVGAKIEGIRYGKLEPPEIINWETINDELQIDIMIDYNIAINFVYFWNYDSTDHKYKAIDSIQSSTTHIIKTFSPGNYNLRVSYKTICGSESCFSNRIDFKISIDSILAIPDQFIINQNYPNPFNAVTTIKYAIPINCFVTIEVYDLLGRELETLLNEEKMPGNYNIEFNAEKYCSGVYFYTMRAGNFIETKKLILLK